MHGILRAVRRNGQPSWHASLHRGGRRLHLHFAHHAYGGEAEALAVAQAWRGAVLAAVPDGPRPRTRHQGTPGLYRIKARGVRAPSWMARIAPDGGRPRTRSFSITRHGEAEARALAEAWLCDQLPPRVPLPVPPPVAPASQPSFRPGRAPQPGRHHDEAFYGLFRVSGRNGQDLWRVHLSRAGRKLQASFPDLTYGGEAPALHVARAWRDAVLAIVPPLTNIALRQIVRRNRTEGMPGVYYNAQRRAWSAVITLADRRTVKHSFKVSAHGEDGARALAEAERLHMLDALENGRDPALRSPAARALTKRALAKRHADLPAARPAVTAVDARRHASAQERARGQPRAVEDTP